MIEFQNIYKSIFFLILVSFFSIKGISQNVNHPSGSSVDASYTVNCGSTVTYRDVGGTGNYTNGQNSLITFCPSTAGQYISVNFTAFSLESNYDFLYVFDGNDGSANLIGVYTGAASPGTITASSANASGCISFRFSSDAATTPSGWTAAVTCTATPATPYPAHGPEDCNGAITICSNSALTGGTTGLGMHELPTHWNQCIAWSENQSNWYVFAAQTNGTIGFQITPSVAADFDWAIWGPYTKLECPAFTSDPTYRCSASQLIGMGNTGLVAPATDTIEQNGEYVACCGSTGDGFLKPMNVIAGEVYVMMIDNWSGSGTNFSLNWNLTNGATLDCTPPLPITLSSMEASCVTNNTLIKWTTESEINNNFFIIEKADESFLFHEIGKVFGSGNSSVNQNYEFIDSENNSKTAYYRLVQVDYDGSIEYHRVVASNCHDNDFYVAQTNLLNNNLDLLISASSNEKISINLFSSTGQLIYSTEEILNAGNNSFSYKGLNTSSGIYLISIKGQINNYSSKLLSK